MKNIAVFLAPGFEEIEALTVVDILRRAKLNVILVAVNDGNLQVTGSHGVTVVAEATPQQLDPSQLSLTVFPGGLPGATNLAKDQHTLAIVRQVVANGDFAAAICAAPVALHAAGVLTTQTYTCYPGCETHIGGNYVDRPAVTDGQIITGRGPGATADFAFEILRNLNLKDVADQLRKGMLY